MSEESNNFIEKIDKEVEKILKDKGYEISKTRKNTTEIKGKGGFGKNIVVKKMEKDMLLNIQLKKIIMVTLIQ